MSKRVFPRCSGACKDGTQCGRRVKDHSQPPLCHLHNGNAHPSPLVPPPDEVDELKILKRLARDSNPQVRLRAVDLLLELKQKDAATHEVGESIWDRVLSLATDAERDRLRDAVGAWREVAADVLDRNPWLLPDHPEWQRYARQAPTSPEPSPVEPTSAPIIEPAATELQPDPHEPIAVNTSRGPQTITRHTFEEATLP